MTAKRLGPRSETGGLRLREANMGERREIELKFTATPEMLGVLRDLECLRGSDCAEVLTTTYFDTPSSALRRLGASLRVRLGEGRREQTLKLTSAGRTGIERGEWTTALGRDRPDPAKFPASARSLLRNILNGARLEPIALTRIERTTRRIESDGSTIEAAFDAGIIEAGHRSAPVCEFELELKSGEAGALFELARQLPLGSELHLSSRSKAERCYGLALNLTPGATGTTALALTRELDFADGFRRILWNCLAHLIANYPLVLVSHDAEAVHQSRVAIRRMRAALGFLGAYVDDDAIKTLSAQMKAVAESLAPARDLHVLAERVRLTGGTGDAAIADLAAHLNSRVGIAIQPGLEVLGSAAYQRLMIEVAGWIEGGKWQQGVGLAAGDKPIDHYARAILSGQRRKLGRFGAAPEKLSDAQRHELRMAAKKLRYASEFFGSLYPSRGHRRDRKAFARAVKQLMDGLGELNDLRGAQALSTAQLDGVEPIAAARMRVGLKRVLGRYLGSRSKHLKKVAQALEQLDDAAGWWKA